MWNIHKSHKRSALKTKSLPAGVSDNPLITEAAFVKMLYVEQKRTERSRRRFILMLLNCGTLLSATKTEGALDEILTFLEAGSS